MPVGIGLALWFLPPPAGLAPKCQRHAPSLRVGLVDVNRERQTVLVDEGLEGLGRLHHRVVLEDGVQAHDGQLIRREELVQAAGLRGEVRLCPW